MLYKGGEGDKEDDMGWSKRSTRIKWWGSLWFSPNNVPNVCCDLNIFSSLLITMNSDFREINTAWDRLEMQTREILTRPL